MITRQPKPRAAHPECDLVMDGEVIGSVQDRGDCIVVTLYLLPIGCRATAMATTAGPDYDSALAAAIEVARGAIQTQQDRLARFERRV